MKANAAEQEAPRPGFWGSLSDTERRVILIGTGALIVGTAGFFIARRAVNKRQTRVTLTKATQDGSAASYAMEIAQAFENKDDWWGIQINDIYKTLYAIPSYKVFREVEREYNKLPDQPVLGTDFLEKLTLDESRTTKIILAGKPDQLGARVSGMLLQEWVSRLTNAGSGWGTDEDAITRVLYEIPDKAGAALLDQTLKNSRGYSLDELLEDELSGEELENARLIISTKR